MVLIMGNCSGKEKSVVDEIHKISDKKVIVFKANKCLDGESIGFNFLNNQSRAFAIIDGKEIELNNVSSVWYWKPFLPKVLRTSEHAYFINRQFLTAWRSLTSFLKDRLWVNNYYNLLEADHKPYQLQVASSIGFDIPDTLITSDPEKAKSFWDYCNKQMVIKTLMLTMTDDKFAFTNKFTEDTLSKIDRIKTSPVILQKIIPSKYELRITIVGGSIFPVKVITNSLLDWRRNCIGLEVYLLSDQIKNKCFKLVKQLGLQYGCIDMIVTPDNQYVFIEINPNGQWSFVEERTGMPIGKAIARLLL